MGRRGARKACHTQRRSAAYEKREIKRSRAGRCNTVGKIYFVRAEGTNFIKIGWTARGVRSRLRQLQTGNAQKLLLLADMPGDQRKERSLHGAFSHLRAQGEWFRDEGSLSDLITCLLAGGAG